MIIIQQTGTGSGGGGGAVTISDTAGNPIVAAGGNLRINLFDSIGQGVLSDSGYLFVALPAAQITQLVNAINGTNGGILIDTTVAVTLTPSLTPLNTAGCKYVTLINLSSNSYVISYRVSGGATCTLEIGYSVRINCINADLIEVSCTNTQDLQYILTQ